MRRLTLRNGIADMLQRLPNVIRARLIADVGSERLCEAAFSNALDELDQALLVEVIGIVHPALHKIARGLVEWAALFR